MHRVDMRKRAFAPRCKGVVCSSAAQPSGGTDGRKGMTEVVHPLDGDEVALRPCPSWCTESRHFAGGEAIYADHGYHHYGTEIEVTTSDTFLGMTDGPQTIVRAVL